MLATTKSIVVQRKIVSYLVAFVEFKLAVLTKQKSCHVFRYYFLHTDLSEILETKIKLLALFVPYTRHRREKHGERGERVQRN